MKIGENGKKRKTVGERAIYTQNVVDRFKDMAVGEKVTYEELSAIIGMEVKSGGPGYSYVYTATKIVAQEYNVVVDNIARFGYERSSADTVGLSTKDMVIAKFKSVTRNAKRRLNAVKDEFDAMTQEAKIGFVTAGTLLALNEHISKHRQVEKLGMASQEALLSGQPGKALPLDKTLELFKK